MTRVPLERKVLNENDRLAAEPDPTRRLTAGLDPHTPRRCTGRSAQISRIEPARGASKGRIRPVKAQDGMKVHDSAALELGDLGKREPIDAVAD